MPRRSTLGDLSWITESKQPNQDSKPRPDILNRLIVKPTQPSSDALPVPATQEELESPLNVDIPASLHSRLHSVVAWDDQRRTLKEMVTHLLTEGLAKIPDKGPAPPSYLARLKSYGKRKTQKS